MNSNTLGKLIIGSILTIASIAVCNAQEFNAPSRHKAVFTDTTTTYTYRMTYKVYKVYKSRNNAFYIWKVSKRSGKHYKNYLPKEIQIKMGRKYTK